jgi:hypothetical protein
MTDASKSNHYCPWIFLGHVTGQYYVEYTIPNLVRYNAHAKKRSVNNLQHMAVWSK